jgi:hypothetical protein
MDLAHAVLDVGTVMDIGHTLMKVVVLEVVSAAPPVMKVVHTVLEVVSVVVEAVPPVMNDV